MYVLVCQYTISKLAINYFYSKTLAILQLWYIQFLPGQSSLNKNQTYSACSAAKTAQFNIIQQSRKQVLRAYCPNIQNSAPTKDSSTQQNENPSCFFVVISNTLLLYSLINRVARIKEFQSLMLNCSIQLVQDLSEIYALQVRNIW